MECAASRVRRARSAREERVGALAQVVPYALLPMDTARYASNASTAAVLFTLATGRARIGRRRRLPTTPKTLGIAAVAGAAGVLAGRMFG